MNLTKLIKPVDDYARVQAQIDAIKKVTDDALAAANAAKAEALSIANDANKKASDAVTTAGNAVTTATESNNKAAAAVTAANNAVATAGAAKDTADNAVDVVNDQHKAMTAEINALAQQIGEKQGTTLTLNGVAVATMAADGLLDVADEIIIKGGNA